VIDDPFLVPKPASLGCDPGAARRRTDREEEACRFLDCSTCSIWREPLCMSMQLARSLVLRRLFGTWRLVLATAWSSAEHDFDRALETAGEALGWVRYRQCSTRAFPRVVDVHCLDRAWNSHLSRQPSPKTGASGGSLWRELWRCLYPRTSMTLGGRSCRADGWEA
jgi:hypothetical protein